MAAADDGGHMVVTLFYPDARSGAHLVGALRRAARALGELEALDPRPWRLDVLRWPEMQAEATRDVASSRIVVVPAEPASAGAEFFQRWMESWSAAQDGSRLLLVPSRRGGGSLAPRIRRFVQWLQALAAQKGMDFAETEITGPRTGEAGARGGRSRVSPPAGGVFANRPGALRKAVKEPQPVRKGDGFSWNLVTKNFQAHEQLRRKLRSKIAKLERHLQRLPLEAVRLEVALEKHPNKDLFSAALSLRLLSHMLRSEKAAVDPVPALDRATKTLLRQVAGFKSSLRREALWKRQGRRAALRQFKAQGLAAPPSAKEGPAGSIGAL
jgi:ribosome-associated translation inhibitor RaiA